MKINKTIQNELDKLPNDIKNKYNISINEDALMLEFESKHGYISVKYDRSFIINHDELCINIKNKKICITLWITNYIWHVTVY